MTALNPISPQWPWCCSQVGGRATGTVEREQGSALRGPPNPEPQGTCFGLHIPPKDFKSCRFKAKDLLNTLFHLDILGNWGRASLLLSSNSTWVGLSPGTSWASVKLGVDFFVTVIKLQQHTPCICGVSFHTWFAGFYIYYLSIS